METGLDSRESEKICGHSEQTAGESALAVSLAGWTQI